MSLGKGWDIPATSDAWSTFHWFQASPKGLLEFVVLCEEPFWYVGHYVGNRMFPCQGSECEFCSEGVGSQVRYVLGVCEVTTRRTGLLEVGRGNGELIRDWTGRHGGLRGMRLEVGKSGRSAQSRTVVTYVDRPCEPWYLGIVVPDIQLALYLTWYKSNMVMPSGFAERMREYKSGPEISRKILDTLGGLTTR